MKKQFAVILAGCGVKDGTEIHEAIMALLAIDLAGAEYTIFAPDKNQHHVVNHITGQEVNETRNIMVESARIARGKIQSLDELNVSDFDALLIPGGFGVAKNLCNYAFDGHLMEIDGIVSEKILDFNRAAKPIGALCIAPIMLAKLFPNAELTLGQNNDSVKHAEMLGANHVDTKHGEVVHDENYNLFTTPCYMLNSSIADIFRGTKNLVDKMIESI